MVLVNRDHVITLYMIAELSRTLIVAYTYLIDTSQKFLRKYASVSKGRCYSGVLPLDKMIIYNHIRRLFYMC